MRIQRESEFRRKQALEQVENPLVANLSHIVKWMEKRIWPVRYSDDFSRGFIHEVRHEVAKRDCYSAYIDIPTR
jgi:hypothetical protein